MVSFEQQDKSHRFEEKEIIESLKGKMVEVYFNLHKKIFSVRDSKTKKVVAHLNEVHISNAIFRVSEKSRQRVIREQRKNVHAYVKGILINYDDSNPTKLGYYNPYTTETFINKETGDPLLEANTVKFINKQVYFA